MKRSEMVARKWTRRDANEDDIVKALEEAGGQWFQTDQPLDGIATWPIGDDPEGEWGTALVEIKMPGEKLRPKQRDFIENWNGKIIVAHTPLELLEYIGKVPGARKPRGPLPKGRKKRDYKAEEERRKRRTATSRRGPS